MKIALLADFGSTYTKLTAVDLEAATVLGTYKAFTTIQDISFGFHEALNGLETEIGRHEYDLKLACSSAAGGLKMVTVGLVKELTAKASEMAALNAGAKVQRVFAYELTETDIKDIKELEPEIILLAGGINGGNKKVIIHNAKMLAQSHIEAFILVAGNKTASDTIGRIFTEANKPYALTENVMPNYNELNIEPARNEIRNIFLERIIDAKGLGQVKTMMDEQVMPTPSAVLKGISTLAHGTENKRGLGDLIAVDVGGATTDVYSIAKQEAFDGNTMLKGLPEPINKRTVEGDLGLKYSVDSLYAALSLEQKRHMDKEAIENYLLEIKEDPSILPEGDRQPLEAQLTYGAVREAVNRHVGYLETQFTIHGNVTCQYGKDLTEIGIILGTGGPVIHGENPAHILSGVCYSPIDENLLKPKKAKYLVDKRYILAAMGLLSTKYPDIALEIMKKEFVEIPSS